MKNIITHGSILALTVLGFILGYYITSSVLLAIQIIFLFIVEINGSEYTGSDCTFIRFFNLKKIYTEWGIFYTGAFGSKIYIFKDVYLFFLFVSEIGTKYNNIKNSEELKDKLIYSIRNSSYLAKRIESLEQKKKLNELRKILNSWSGFTNKQLERDHKISKLL